jgi:hypothetical protein
MKGMYDFLSRGFACLAVALVIVSVLAMPTQVVLANDPSSGGSTYDTQYCEANDPPQFCPYYHCLWYGSGDDAGCCCNYSCNCPT